MSRFSLKRLGEATERSVRRFPVTLLAAVVAGVTAAALVDNEDSQRLRDIVMSVQLGIPLFLVIALVAERRERWNLPGASGIILRLAGLGLLIVYGISRPSRLDVTDWLLFVQLNVGLHLLVTVLPFARRGETRGMWQFNLALLLRFLTAAFFSAVLYGGLSLALLALENLLGVDINDSVYGQLWCLIAFVFNTAYFLGGVPERLEDLDRIDTYPRLVRIFAQYILAPLVVVYLSILLAYLVKVVTTAVWPSGWIGYLVSSVAAAGLLSLLLLKPDSERDDRRWVRIYARLFHVLMVPAVVMLVLAISQRIGQYGLTEMRYFLAVLTIWLAVIVLAGCFRRRLLLKAIPASLCLLAFLTAFGPWSVYAVSHRSQLGRLDGLLAAQSRFASGMIVADQSEVSSEDSREISGILHYLFDHFGTGALGDRIDSELRAGLDEQVAQATNQHSQTIALATATAEFMNMEYINKWQLVEAGRFEFDRKKRGAAVVIGDYDVYIPLHLRVDNAITVTLEADSCQVMLAGEVENLTMTRRGQPYLTVPLAAMFEALREYGGRGLAPDSLLEVTTETATVRARLYIERISWNENDDGLIGHGTLVGDLLIGFADESKIGG